jgi:hypothetical protein
MDEEWEEWQENLLGGKFERSLRWIEVGGIPMPADDLEAWALWWTQEDRQVALDDVGEARVSTVFLGIDHGFLGVPMLYETMIFGGPLDQYQERYTLREQAIEGHARAVSLAREHVLDEQQVRSDE